MKTRTIPRSRTASLVARVSAIAVLAVSTLAGCSAAVALDPAADGTNPSCAAVVVALPETVADFPSRETNAQGTGAWGSGSGKYPTSVLLRCGVPVPSRASALPCVLVGDVYWLRDGTDAPTFIFTTYGREPATEVIVTQRPDVSPGAALYDLQNAVDLTKSTAKCTTIEDSLGTTDGSGDGAGGTSTNAPEPTPTP